MRNYPVLVFLLAACGIIRSISKVTKWSDRHTGPQVGTLAFRNPFRST